MNKHIIGKMQHKGDGVCTANIYTEKGYYKGEINVSNGCAYDSQPSGTLLFKKIGKKSKGVKILTSIGYINVPEYELYETNKWDNVQKEVSDFIESAQSEFTDNNSYQNWLNLFNTHEECNVNLALQILNGLKQKTQHKLNPKKCKR